jgi:hypothetical protein
MKYRSRFLTIGAIGFFVVPTAALLAFWFFF